MKKDNKFQFEALTFDDVLLIPSYSEVLPSDTDITTSLTKNISLNISIDALTKNLYEQIRVNGDFDIVMKNFNVFKQYCDIAVMVNPMTNNWFQMKDFVDFCNENDVYLGYNTVRYPKHLSIQHMPVEMIEDVYLTLHKQVNTYPNKNHNWKRFEYLVETQIKNWMLEKWNG